MIKNVKNKHVANILMCCHRNVCEMCHLGSVSSVNTYLWCHLLYEGSCLKEIVLFYIIVQKIRLKLLF